MSETALLEQVTSEILRDFAERVAPGASGAEGWAPALWATLEEAGLPLVGVPESSGGPGGGWPEIAAVLRAAGRFAAPVPLAETCALANWLLSQAGLPIPSGPLSVVPTHPDDHLELERSGDDWVLRGTAARVPWAAVASAIVVLVRSGDGWAVVTVRPDVCQIEQGANLAGEPRDRVTLNGVRLSRDAQADVSVDADRLLVRGALARSIQVVGALERVLESTVSYVQARTQFGRPIGRFQAVQHELARLAGEVVASAAAVESAVLAIDRGGGTMEVAAAKVRTGEAASAAARIAHQLHGAIGYTQEHHLHQLTTRLWSWRDEYGAESLWAARLGRFAAGAGPVGYWDWFTSSPSAPLGEIVS